MNEGRRRGVRLFGVLSFVLLGGLFALLVHRAPPGSLDLLHSARPFLVCAGLAVYALAWAARGLRLILLLPPDDRIPFGRAWSLSGATGFLLQVIPFRGGELASWGAFRSALGSGWARSGAVLALAKTVDTATLLLVGLAGVAVLAGRNRAPSLLRGTTAGLVVSVALLLGLLPWGGTAAWARIAPRLREGSRLRRIGDELARALGVGRRQPTAYFAAFAGSLAFFLGNLASLWLLMRGLGAPASLAGLAFATLTSVAAAVLLPSPAGTFGPAEYGFAAGLTADGMPAAVGAVAGALVHVLTTAVCGFVGLPFFLRSSRTGRGAHAPRV